jgi:DHA1 family bicyclomycin/chloramphenicol resistance-like MFS transporter
LTKKKPSDLFIICLLGALSVISPFAIDMYLPAFPQVAHDLHVSNATIALTISSYFIGLACGQVFYGPLLDRYGRKKPLLAGLSIYILASFACAVAPDIHWIIAFRFIQAIGGCAAGVASLAIVHDFFPVEDAARILSRLFLFIAVSPLLAPSVGGMVALTIGWRAVFLILGGIVAGIFVLIALQLPESHKADTTISLKPWPIIVEYFSILIHPRFATYALTGAFSFAGLFAYVAGSPIIFMDGFHLSPKMYSGMFALLSTGFIGGSQINITLLRHWKSEQIFKPCLALQMIISVIFAIGTYLGWCDLISTLVLFYLFLSVTGLICPNAAALAMAPFNKNAGSASALLGFLQLGIGALVSTGISTFATQGSFPIIAMLAVTTVIGLIILLIGEQRARKATREEAF